MTNADLKTAVRDDLSIATGDAFYSDAYVQRMVNRAVRWYAALHPWQQTQYGYRRDSVAGQEYYNYPEKFRTDTIWKLKFNSIRYDRKDFSEYLNYLEDHGGTTSDKIYTDHRRQFFINPAPTVVAEITVWGHLIPDEMSADEDTHPFADEADAEEAIVKYALGLCLKKGRGSFYEKGKIEISEAEAMATKAWEAQKREQSKYQTKDIEIFDFVDILPPNGGERRTQRGNFETYP